MRNPVPTVSEMQAPSSGSDSVVVDPISQIPPSAPSHSSPFSSRRKRAAEPTVVLRLRQLDLLRAEARRLQWAALRRRWASFAIWAIAGAGAVWGGVILAQSWGDEAELGSGVREVAPNPADSNPADSNSVHSNPAQPNPVEERAATLQLPDVVLGNSDAGTPVEAPAAPVQTSAAAPVEASSASKQEKRSGRSAAARAKKSPGTQPAEQVLSLEDLPTE